MCDSKTAQVYEMLLSVVRSLVDHPEEIKVSVITEETSTLFQVRSCSRDIGKLIGSKGRTAKALRIILAANAMKLNPGLKVQLNAGYFDLATPFYQGIYEMHHLPIPANLQANIEYKFYESGHMVYAKDSSLKLLHDNVAGFIRRTATPGN